MRIAIVNDMFMAVEAMRRVLARARGHEVAWIARDGAEAVERCRRDRPDLILMDLIMPRLDGVEATRQIMANTPCAIVVVTASVDDHTPKVFEAMGAGALDAVNTPTLAGSGEESARLLAKIETIGKLIGPTGTRAFDHPPAQAAAAGDSAQCQLVAMGASAGGPAALAKVLSFLPADFPAAVVVVQHVDAQFAPGLAEWLGRQTGMRVRLAQEGDRLNHGHMFLAAREQHLVLTSPTQLGYTKSPVDAPHHPSVDVLFQSVKRHAAGRVVGVLLTGMGRDGAAGLKQLRDHGHHTIAQDQTSSAVYGMPKAAAELNAASEILPLEHIGPRLLERLKTKRQRPK